MGFGKWGGLVLLLYVECRLELAGASLPPEMFVIHNCFHFSLCYFIIHSLRFGGTIGKCNDLMRIDCIILKTIRLYRMVNDLK